jgi:thiosulfate reductase cytochrome b subunit
VSRPGQGEGREPQGGDLVRRHRLSTRIWHWVNAVTVAVMLMSGLMIFNAHPRLYWGEYGANFDHAWLAIGATTRAIPGWATIPSTYSLADARLWHFAFAWVLVVGLLVYLPWSLVNGHLRRDIHIPRAQWRPAHIWHDIRQHARLRFPAGAAALRYGVLQKIAYAAVLFGLLPLAIVTGLAMAPGVDAAWPFLTEIWGGRQSARSLHFIAAFGLVAFFGVHIVMVLLAGPVNELRAMITGWYRLPAAKAEEGA